MDGGGGGPAGEEESGMRTVRVMPGCLQVVSRVLYYRVQSMQAVAGVNVGRADLVYDGGKVARVERDGKWSKM